MHRHWLFANFERLLALEPKRITIFDDKSANVESKLLSLYASPNLRFNTRNACCPTLGIQCSLLLRPMFTGDVVVLDQVAPGEGDGECILSGEAELA